MRLFRETADTRTGAEKVHEPRTSFYVRIKEEPKAHGRHVKRKQKPVSKGLPLTNMGRCERQTKENDGLQLTGLLGNHESH